MKLPDKAIVALLKDSRKYALSRAVKDLPNEDYWYGKADGLEFALKLLVPQFTSLKPKKRKAKKDDGSHWNLSNPIAI